MPAIEDVDFKDPHSIIRLLAKRRYGPNGNIAQVGRRVTLIEAGYVTARGWWGVPKALAEANTNFHRVEVSIRLELIVCDLLQRPEMAATRKWSASFGYSSPATISRALWTHFEVGLGEFRRMGLLGQWVALQSRTPRSPRGIDRQEEASLRIAHFRAHMAKRELGPDAMKLVEQLGTFASSRPDRARPRYPPMGRRELTSARDRP